MVVDGERGYSRPPSLLKGPTKNQETMNQEIFNPAPLSPVTLQSDVLGMPRYSNETATGSDGGSGLGTGSSGSGVFDWGGFFSDLFGAGSNIVTSVWGTGDKYMANAYQTMYNNERKTTNTMIAIVIAFVLLAFAFLLLKKK